MKSPDRDAADERIRELEKLVYVPGHWRCAKCRFYLVSTLIHAESGNFAANNEPQQCGNGCGPMWRVTEREAGNTVCDRLEEQASELATLRRRVETESEHVLKYGRHSDGCPRGQPVGDSNGPWECNCGFSAALDEAMFSLSPPTRKE